MDANADPREVAPGEAHCTPLAFGLVGAYAAAAAAWAWGVTHKWRSTRIETDQWYRLVLIFLEWTVGYRMVGNRIHACATAWSISGKSLDAIVYKLEKIHLVVICRYTV